MTIRLWVLFIIYGVVAIAVKSVWHLPGHFLLLAVIYLAFYEDWRFGSAASLVLGFLLDMSSYSPLGTSLFSFGIVFGLIRFIRTKILFRTFPSRFWWVGIFSLLEGLSSHFLANLLGSMARPFSIFFPRLLAGSVVNAALGLILIPFLFWYRNFTFEQLTKRKDILLKK